MEQWQIIAAIIASFTALLGTVFGIMVRRKTSREGNEILTFKEVNIEMRELRAELQQCVIDCTQCRKDHADTMIELGKQRKVNEDTEADLKAAHNAIRELRAMVEGDHDILKLLEKKDVG